MGSSANTLSRIRRRVIPRPLLEHKERVERLLQMYRRLERRYARPWPPGRSGWLPALPAPDRIEKIENAALRQKTFDDFAVSLERTADLQRAAVAAFRPVINRGRDGRARSIALALQHNPETARAGDAARAILAIWDRQPEFAWALLSKYEPAEILPLAPGEYFRAGLTVAPEAAISVLRQLKAGEIQCAIDAKGWRGIAYVTFAYGAEDLSIWAIGRAITASNGDPEIAESATRLRTWYGRRERRNELEAPHPIAFALLDDSSPQRPKGRQRKPNRRQQRVMIGELARHPGARYEGDVAFVRQVNDAVARSDPDRSADASATVWLYRVGRNATAYADVPQGTWLVMVGQLPRPLFGLTPSFPVDERYRPVFASIRIEDSRALSALNPRALDQLRQYAPVGCGDWDTYYLMRAANIPAFLARDAPDALGAIVTRITAGDDETAVRQAWHDACAPAVAKGLARDAGFATPHPIELNIAKACADIRKQAVVIERSQPAPDGPEINIEFSLDGNLKHQMVVCLDSIVRRASRPIRLFVMCRDHDANDFDRLARLFPTVSFVWLSTEEVEHGDLAAMIEHITVATMDRLLLPDLLSDVDRIIHHDIDTICLADLAELWDIDLEGHPLAAARSTRGRFQSGFNEIRGTAYRLRRQGRPELADDLIARTHLRLDYDFTVFNAGVMVFDLARMRADSFCRTYFPYVELYEMNDQGVLNAYAGADRLDLDTAWNWSPRLEDNDQPKIVHWAGKFKPWKPAWVRAEELWFEAERQAATRG